MSLIVQTLPLPTSMMYLVIKRYTPLPLPLPLPRYSPSILSLDTLPRYSPSLPLSRVNLELQPSFGVFDEETRKLIRKGNKKDKQIQIATEGVATSIFSLHDIGGNEEVHRDTEELTVLLSSSCSSPLLLSLLLISLRSLLPLLRRSYFITAEKVLRCSPPSSSLSLPSSLLSSLPLHISLNLTR